MTYIIKSEASEVFDPYCSYHDDVSALLAHYLDKPYSSTIDWFNGEEDKGKKLDIPAFYQEYSHECLVLREKKDKIEAAIYHLIEPTGSYYVVTASNSISIWFTPENLEHAQSMLKFFREKYVVYTPPAIEVQVDILTASMHGLSSHSKVMNWDRLSPEEVAILYGTDRFEEFVGLIEQAKGLILLSGEPGTGKTTLIRNAITESFYRRQSNKDIDTKFLILTSDTTKSLGSPVFVSYFIEHEKPRTFIAEDAEEALRPRDDADSSTTPVFLNLTDGILGEVVDAGIVATLNCNIDEIDKALLRDGRCLMNWVQKPLNFAQAYTYWKYKYDSNPKLYKEPEGVTESITIASLYKRMRLTP